MSDQIERKFSWPMAFTLVAQTIALLGSLFAFALYNERRLTQLESSLAFNRELLGRLAMVQESQVISIQTLRDNQTKVITILDQMQRWRR